MKPTHLFSCMLALAAILAAPALAADPPLRIGVGAPLTGPIAKLGHDIENGARLAAEDANAKGGVLGRKIELVVSDDKGDPREGVTVATKMANSGVFAVIGHLNSGVSIPTSQEVYVPKKIIEVSPASTNPTYTDRKLKGIFRVIGRDDQQGQVAAAFGLKKGKKAVVIHNKAAYGQGLAEEFKKAYEKGGGTVSLFDGVTSGDKDFRALLTRVRGLAPDVIFFGGEYADAGLFAKQARQLGIKAALLGGDALYDPTFVQLAGKNGVANTFITFPPAPKDSGFKARYGKKYGALGAYSGYTYDAVNVVLEGIRRAKKVDYEAVVKQMMALKDYAGVTGKISFDAKGDLTRAGFAIWEVKADGTFQEMGH